jgi:hypothetical protein
MSSTMIDIYCDESCHLENDSHSSMIIGAVWCPAEKTKEIAIRLREIKLKHKLGADFEMKWGKVSPSKLAFYLEILDYFFDDDDLHFRAVIIPDKKKIDHSRFDQTHDSWYYKMYFTMLKLLLGPKSRYCIYLDIKDTCSAKRVSNLHEVLCNNMYDFQREIIERVQTVRSHEVQQVQLADLLVGLVGYANRDLETSRAKKQLVERMKKRSRYTLKRTTLVREDKVNLLLWSAKVGVE